MKSTTTNLQKLLEQATSHAPPTESDELSTEARELREAWQGWSELLERADAARDERWMLATVATWETQSAPPRSRSRWYSVALALSLTLLVAGALGQLDVLTSRLAVDGPARLARASRSERNATGAELQAPEAYSPEAVTSPQATSDSDSLLTWDDSFDERLAEASETLTSIHASWYSPSNSHAWLEQRLSDLRSDFDDGSL